MVPCAWALNQAGVSSSLSWKSLPLPFLSLLFFSLLGCFAFSSVLPPWPSCSKGVNAHDFSNSWPKARGIHHESAPAVSKQSTKHRARLRAVLRALLAYGGRAFV